MSQQEDKVIGRITVHLKDEPFKDGLDTEVIPDMQYHRDLKFRDITLGIDNILMAKRYAERTKKMYNDYNIYMQDKGIDKRYNVDLNDPTKVVNKHTGHSELDNIDYIGRKHDNTIADMLTILRHPQLDTMDVHSQTAILSKYRNNSKEIMSKMTGKQLEAYMMRQLPEYMQKSTDPGKAFEALKDYSTVDLGDPKSDKINVMKDVIDIDASTSHINAYIKKQADRYQNDNGIDLHQHVNLLDRITLHNQQETQERVTSYYDEFDKDGRLYQDAPSHQAREAYQEYLKHEIPNKEKRDEYTRNISHAMRLHEERYFGADRVKMTRKDVLFFRDLQADPKTRIDDPEELQQRLQDHMRKPLEERNEAYKELKETQNLAEQQAKKQEYQDDREAKEKSDQMRNTLYEQKGIHPYMHKQNERQLVDEEGHVLTNNDNIVKLFKAAWHEAMWDMVQDAKKREADIQLMSEQLSLGISPLDRALDRGVTKVENKLDAKRAKKQAKNLAKQFNLDKDATIDDYQHVINAIVTGDMDSLNQEQLKKARDVKDYRASSERLNIDQELKQQTKVKKKRKKRRKSRSNDGPEL